MIFLVVVVELPAEGVSIGNHLAGKKIEMKRFDQHGLEISLFGHNDLIIYYYNVKKNLKLILNCVVMLYVVKASSQTYFSTWKRKGTYFSKLILKKIFGEAPKALGYAFIQYMQIFKKKMKIMLRNQKGCIAKKKLYQVIWQHCTNHLIY